MVIRNRLKLSAETADYEVESAGVWANAGRPATQQAQAVAQERGEDLSGHRSRSIEEINLLEFALILTMEQGQKEAISLEFPQVATRVHMLSELVGFEVDIEDPYGKSLADYRTTLKLIESYVERGWKKLLRLTSK
jgi:protein-tyrosine-phosphatase